MATKKKTSRRKPAKAKAKAKTRVKAKPKARAKARAKPKAKAKAKKKTASKTAGRRATTRLDVVFYPKKALDKAQKAFAHLASIKITKKGNLYEIKFSGMSASTAARLPDEFANFALSCAVVEP